MDDHVNAFAPHPLVDVAHAHDGPLSGLTLAVKDIFDVAGYKTGCGSPARLAEASVARRTAPAIQSLLDAGAEMVGKTTTEELAFSLNGDNGHYPRPINSAAPNRLTGGSSSGSAAAVSAGLADIATGTDTGGSIRVPASYCGLIGLRPTHGRLSLDSTMPLAESLDTFGWFAKDAETYARVGDVLLGADVISYRPTQVLVAEDCLSLLMGIEEAHALDPAINHVTDYADTQDICLAEDDIQQWYWTFRKIQAFEAWKVHGAWITAKRPALGAGIQERFDYSSKITQSDYDEACLQRGQISRHMDELIGEEGLLVLPTVPSIAPLAGTDPQDLEDFRNRALILLCISSLTGLPQITLPMATLNGAPLGLSLMGARGSDQQLMNVGIGLLENFKEKK